MKKLITVVSASLAILGTMPLGAQVGAPTPVGMPLGIGRGVPMGAPGRPGMPPHVGLTGQIGAAPQVGASQVGAPAQPVTGGIKAENVVITMTTAPATSGSMDAAMAAKPTAVAKSAGMPAEIHWVRNSAEYKANCFQAYSLAESRLQEMAPKLVPSKWAVILDADETTLDNSQLQKEIGGHDLKKGQFDEWVRRGISGAVPGAKHFLDKVHELGGMIAIVTNRTTATQSVTEGVYKRLEMPYDIMLCYGTTGDKNPRFESVEKGTAKDGVGPLDVVMYVGDNIRDFPKLTQDLRNGSDSGFADFGKKYIIIPNPMYGSWTSNPEQ